MVERNRQNFQLWAVKIQSCKFVINLRYKIQACFKFSWKIEYEKNMKIPQIWYFIWSSLKYRKQMLRKLVSLFNHDRLEVFVSSHSFSAFHYLHCLRFIFTTYWKSEKRHHENKSLTLISTLNIQHGLTDIARTTVTFSPLKFQYDSVQNRTENPSHNEGPAYRAPEPLREVM